MNKIVLFLLLSIITFPCFAGECDFIQLNACQSCDSLYSFPVGDSRACSFLCPNREANDFGSGSGSMQTNCALKRCPDTAPYQNEEGSCYKTKEEAENVFTNKRGNLFENENILHPNRKEACPEKNQFKRWDGRCFSCDIPKVVWVGKHCNSSSKECDNICPNRTIIKSIGGNAPSVPNCPKEKPLMDDEGVCYSCSTPIPIGVAWNKDFCHRFCPNERHLNSIGDLCILNQTENSTSTDAKKKFPMTKFAYAVLHQKIEQIYFSIDDVLGNYYEFTHSKNLDFTISKDKSGKIRIDDSDKYMFICDIDKETNEDIYLNCEDKQNNEKYDWFKHPYVIISKMKSNLITDKGYLYITYHLSGKKNYEEHNCDEKRKNGIFDRINCTTIEKSGYKREE